MKHGLDVVKRFFYINIPNSTLSIQLAFVAKLVCNMIKIERGEEREG